MNRRKISQAEARRLRKRVSQLEWEQEMRDNRYSSEYPSAVKMGAYIVGAERRRDNLVARRFAKYFVGRIDNDGDIILWAVT